MKIITGTSSTESSEKESLQSRFIMLFVEQLQMLHSQENIVVGLSGGNSLISFYRALVDIFPSIPYAVRQKIRFSFLDERIVPLDDSESNFRLVSDILFAPLLEKALLSLEQIYSVQTTLLHPEREYSLQVPRIDIGLFGVGPDGHVASLFPNHSGMQDSGEGYIAISDSPKPPAKRISISPFLAKHCLYPSVFFISESKRSAYEIFFDPNISENFCPAKIFQNNKNCTVVTDLV